jgi:hypothetical protein
MTRRQEEDSAGVAKFINFPLSLIFSSCLEFSTFPKSFPAQSSGNQSSPKKVIHLAMSYRKVRKARIYPPLLASAMHGNPESDMENRG